MLVYLGLRGRRGEIDNVAALPDPKWDTKKRKQRAGNQDTPTDHRGYFWFDLSSAAGSFSASAWLRRSTMRSIL